MKKYISNENELEKGMSKWEKDGNNINESEREDMSEKKC